jgi:hypothetical protein
LAAIIVSLREIGEGDYSKTNLKRVTNVNLVTF